MGGLGEHVEGFDVGDFVAGLEELFEIASERAGHTGDVEDAGGFFRGEGSEKFGVEAGAGRVAEDGVGAEFFKEDRGDGLGFAFVEVD